MEAKFTFTVNGKVVGSYKDGSFPTGTVGMLINLNGTEVPLQVTIIGYRPLSQTARVGDSNVRLGMSVAAVSLDEIVVTGTAGSGAQLRAIGNVVGTMDAAKVLAVTPALGVEQLLSGRTPGLMVLPDRAPRPGPSILARAHRRRPSRRRAACPS